MAQDLRMLFTVLGPAAIVILVFIVFWQFPALLVYGFLAVVAIIALGGLRLVVAAWLDPRGRQSSDAGRMPGRTLEEVQALQAERRQNQQQQTEPAAPRRKRSRRSRTRRKPEQQEPEEGPPDDNSDKNGNSDENGDSDSDQS